MAKNLGAVLTGPAGFFSDPPQEAILACALSHPVSTSQSALATATLASAISAGSACASILALTIASSTSVRPLKNCGASSTAVLSH